MMYLVYLTDRWGVDTYNILICNTQEQADNLVERYDKQKNRFNNLSESDVQYRKEVIKYATENNLSNGMRLKD